MRAFSDERGVVFILYRTATERIHRDMTLLISTDRGGRFRAMTVGPWELNACPMSTAYLNEGGQRVLVAWETAGQVYFDEIEPGASADRQHPAVAANSDGQVLLAWAEGTGWQKGGSLAWQLFDAAGKPIGAEGRATGVPVWGLSSVVADRQGNFTIVY
jgi:hypothetical protein